MSSDARAGRGDVVTVAEIRLSHPDLVLSPTIRAVPEVTVEREFQPVPISDESALVLFFSVSGDLSNVAAALLDDATVTDAQVIADREHRRLYRVGVTDRATLVTSKLAEFGIRLLDVRNVGADWLFRLLLPDRRALSAFKEYCDGEGIAFEVKTMYRREEEGAGGGLSLTDLQRETLVLARRRGYFDDPRRTSLRELADEAGVSPTAMGRRIRRATARLVDDVLRPDE